MNGQLPDQQGNRRASGPVVLAVTFVVGSMSAYAASLVWWLFPAIGIDAYAPFNPNERLRVLLGMALVLFGFIGSAYLGAALAALAGRRRYSSDEMMDALLKACSPAWPRSLHIRVFRWLLRATADS